MHTLGQEKYENEHKTIKPQAFRPSITAEHPKPTAPQRTAPTPMLCHDLSMHRSGSD